MASPDTEWIGIPQGINGAAIELTPERDGVIDRLLSVSGDTKPGVERCPHLSSEKKSGAEPSPPSFAVITLVGKIWPTNQPQKFAVSPLPSSLSKPHPLAQISVRPLEPE